MFVPPIHVCRAVPLAGAERLALDCRLGAARCAAAALFGERARRRRPARLCAAARLWAPSGRARTAPSAGPRRVACTITNPGRAGGPGGLYPAGPVVGAHVCRRPALPLGHACAAGRLYLLLGHACAAAVRIEDSRARRITHSKSGGCPPAGAAPARDTPAPCMAAVTPDLRQPFCRAARPWHTLCSGGVLCQTATHGGLPCTQATNTKHPRPSVEAQV
ncbi:MAG: hypothetical protein J3K34DRAFT_433506 [Monoraphidium minutum]|nr:MAG: hypothetical protein J3K34DRAFT_433506 [Monoraphidium minutum]